MAMICVSGCRECDGCGMCDKESEVIGYCVVCDEAIYAGEEYYGFDGDLVHDDHLIEWAAKFRKD